MAAGESKAYITYVRRPRAGDRPQSASRIPSFQGYRATKQWVEESGQCRGEKVQNGGRASSRKKDGRVHFKQEENEHTSKLSPRTGRTSPTYLRKDAAPESQTAALSPISLNALSPHFRLLSNGSAAKPSQSVVPGSIQPTPTQTIVGNASDNRLPLTVPFMKSDGEKKVVWSNPAFRADSGGRSLSTDSAPSARFSPPSCSKPEGEERGRDLPQPIRRLSMGEEEPVPSSRFAIPGFVSPEKNGSSPGISSVSAVAGSSPATVMVETPEGCCSHRTRFELEAVSGNWYTPVGGAAYQEMSVPSPDSMANSQCVERLRDLSRTRRTLATMPAFKAASLQPTSAQSNRPVGDAVPRHDAQGGSNRRRTTGHGTAFSDWESERKNSQKLAMQQVIAPNPPIRDDCKRSRSHKAGSRGAQPAPFKVSMASPLPLKPHKAQLQGAGKYYHEAMVEADLEADIAREIEDEIAKEIVYLSQRLAALHARQESRRMGLERGKIGHSCPQTPLRSAPSPSDEEKKRPLTEPKRRKGRVVAAKFLQGVSGINKGAHSADRNSHARGRFMSDGPFLGAAHLPRRSLGTPARLLTKGKSRRRSSCSPDHTEKSLTAAQSPPAPVSASGNTQYKVSAEDYVKERAAASSSKTRAALIRGISRQEEPRDDPALNNSSKKPEHVRSLSMGAAVQSRYYPDFDRKIDWVKTLRSGPLPQCTSGLVNTAGTMVSDVDFPKQFSREKPDVQAWLHESHEVEAAPACTLPPTHSPFITPQIVESQLDTSTSPCVAQFLNARSVGRPPVTGTAWTTPTRSASASTRKGRTPTPSSNARSIPSRYGTPVRATSQSPGVSKYVDPKLVLESPMRRAVSAGKEAVSSKGGIMLRKPTTRRGYPASDGCKPVSDTGEDSHCARHHQLATQSSAGRIKDRKSPGSNECASRRRSNFEAEYETFVERANIEEQVSELYHAAMEGGGVAAAAAESGQGSVGKRNSPSEAEKPAKSTYIRCADLIKDKSKMPEFWGGKRLGGQSVLPCDGQDSDDSVLARSIPRTDSSEQDLEESTMDERSNSRSQASSPDEEMPGSECIQKPERKLVAADGDGSSYYSLVLKTERKSLPKIRAKGNTGQTRGLSPRDSGCVKRTYGRERISPFFASRIGDKGSDSEGLSPDEIEGLDLESFWCLVGEPEGPIMRTRP